MSIVEVHAHTLYRYTWYIETETETERIRVIRLLCFPLLRLRILIGSSMAKEKYVPQLVKQCTLRTLKYQTCMSTFYCWRFAVVFENERKPHFIHSNDIAEVYVVKSGLYIIVLKVIKSVHLCDWLKSILWIKLCFKSIVYVQAIEKKKQNQRLWTRH